MRKAKDIEKDLSKLNNNAQSFFRTIELLREAGNGYRATSKNYDQSVLYSSILDHYRAININNGSGKYIIVI